MAQRSGARQPGIFVHRWQAGPERIAQRFLPSLQLVFGALFVAVVTAVPLGIAAAVRKYSALDYLLTGAALFAISIPTFSLGLLAIYVFR